MSNKTTKTAQEAPEAEGKSAPPATPSKSAESAAPAEANTSARSEDCGSNCSSCGVEGCGERTTPTHEKLAPHPKAHIAHIIAVVSGKGGVGKSLVTSQLAAACAAEGKKVGILDADITGPTMARAFGISEHLKACEDGLIPRETPEGIKVISTNMILPEETTPVLWRGSMITNLIRQFFTEALWGELDYLFIDMPPGTGDVALTVFQSLPIDGIVIVTAPQDLVSMIVGKAINMAHMMEVPVLGIVENLSYFECPGCGSAHSIFGESDIEQLAASYGIEHTARVPIDPQYARHMDAGEATALAISSLQTFAAGLLNRT